MKWKIFPKFQQSSTWKNLFLYSGNPFIILWSEELIRSEDILNILPGDGAG